MLTAFSTDLPLHSIEGLGTRIHINSLNLDDLAPSVQSHWNGHQRLLEIKNDDLGYTAYVGIHQHLPHPPDLRLRLTEGYWLAHQKDSDWLRFAWTWRKFWYGQWTLGGMRVNDFASDEDADIDVLRLSEGMGFKSALSVPYFGGGKVTIRVPFDPQDKSKLAEKRAIQQDVAKILNQLQIIITAIDINTSTDDVIEMAKTAPYSVVGHESIPYGGTIASPQTGEGIVLGMRAAVEVKFPEKDGREFPLEGLSVAQQGAGGVGSAVLERLLRREKIGKVILAEINPETRASLNKKYAGEISQGRLKILEDPEKIYDVNGPSPSLVGLIEVPFALFSYAVEPEKFIRCSGQPPPIDA